MAEQHELVEISHPDIEVTARVPRSALASMDPRWQIVDAGAAGAAGADAVDEYLCPDCAADPTSQRAHAKCDPPEPAVVVTEATTVAPKRAESKKEQ